MKKGTRVGLLVSFLVVVMVCYAKAENVSVQTAQTAAQSFLNSKMGGNPQIHLIDFAEKADFPNFYVFGNESCFIIIAADDCVHPVLGYSIGGGMDAEAMPDVVKDWLKAYNDGIEAAKDSELEIDEETRLEWECLINGRSLKPKSRSRVEPLIKTRWQYATPFNNLCPADSSGPGGHAKAGCGAVAMSQLMNYWEHPVRGNGSHSYNDSTYGQLSANFGATTYDWDNMRNVYQRTYSDAEADAVATLVYHCGVSVEMNYGPDASGTSTSRIDDALIAYFDYNSSMSYKEKANYSNEAWIALLKADLDNERPVIYRGTSQGSDGGHIFLCDSYDENNYFHFNWGYAGRWDGYYAMGALFGGADYSYGNIAIFGIYPNSTSINPPANVNTSVDGRTVTISWNSVNNASSYKIYCDNDLIASSVTSTSYTNTNVPYGEHRYYVKSVKSDGTMSLKSNTAIADIQFSGPVPTGLYATTSGYDVNLSWDTPMTEDVILQYGTGNLVAGVGGVGNGFYWAQRFPTTTLSDYAGMAVQKVSFYFRKAGTYIVSLYKGDEANPMELVSQQQYQASSINSWQDIVFPNPVPIDFTKDLWVVLYADNSISHPATFCYYSGTDVVSVSLYSSVEQATIWKQYIYTDTNNVSHTTSWLMKTYITDGTYTYNLYRNGDVVAANLSNNSYTDSNLPDGFYDYHVTTNYFGGESDPSNTVNVMVGNPTYIINVSANPNNGGTVTGGGTYNYNQSCTVTATPNMGYTFVNWTENGTVVSSNASYTFAVTANRNLVAHFQLQSFTITVTTDPSTGGMVTGGGTYNYGQTCTLSATPATGYEFVNWTKNGTQVSTNANYSFTVTESAAYVAHFQLQPHTVTVTANPSNGGTVMGGGTYNYGQTCTVVATSANGYTFVNWTENGDVVSTNASYSFTVNADRTLVANFLLDNYVVSLSAEPANVGNVTGGGAFHYGDNCTVIATSNPGFNFVNWTENGTQVSPDASYSFTVTGSRTLVAHFTSQNYVITATAEPSDGGMVSGAGGYNYGEACHLTATANSGFTFLNWTKNGTVVSNEPGYTFTVTESATYVAHFQAQSYSVSVSANPMEGGTVSGGGSFTYGQQCTVQATSNLCYTFDNWTENGNVVSNQPDYRFAVTGNRNLVANFILSHYTVFVDIEPEEGGFVIGAGTHPCGEAVTMEAVACENYVFVAWLEDGNIISTNPAMTIAVVGNRHFTARFAFVDGIGENASPIEVFPNPANDVLYVKGEGISSVKVINMLGQVVESVGLEHQNSLTIDTSRYETGVYFLKIRTINGTVTKPFIKQ